MIDYAPRHPDDLDWEKAERRWPGCSAEWDVTASRFIGYWIVKALYEGAMGNPVVFVSGAPGKWAYFVFANGRWHRS